MEGSFSRLAEKPDDRPIIGWDSEDDSKGRPVSFGFVGDDGEFYCRRRQDAIDYVYSAPDGAIFMAHNLEYDCNNLFKEDSWHFYESLKYSSKLISARLKGRNILFIDSSSFFNGSLERLGDILGVPKLEKEERSRFSRRYLMRDAEIVYLFGKRLQKEIAAEGLKMPVTIGQLSMKLYRSRFMHANTIKTWNSELSLRSYYGGRVEIFYKGTVKGNVRVSDINSSYPNVMRNEWYPDTSTIEQSSIDTHRYGVGDFTVYVPPDIYIPPLPYKSSGRRLWFPCGRFRGCWTYAEIRYAQSLGVKILEEHSGEGTNHGCRPFTAFVDHLYPQRQKIKQQLAKDPDNADLKFKNEYIKLEQNNLYGKFAQHRPITEVTKTPLTEEEEQQRGILTKIEKRLGFYLYEFEREKPPATANYMWGAYITSYARINLHQGMQAVHDAGGTLLYCDTDSVMYSGLESSPLELNASRLGCWDEEKFDLGHFEQSKGYLLCRKTGRITQGMEEHEIKKIACKGVPTRARYDFFMDGRAVFRKPIKLRESLVLIAAARRKDKPDELIEELQANYWREVPKRMRGIYIKRSGEVGRTYPVDAQRIDEIEESIRDRDHGGLAEHFRQSGVRLVDKYGNEVDPFVDEKIPDDWFISLAPKNRSAVRTIHTLNISEVETLKDRDVWFRADRIGHHESNQGAGEMLLITEYMGKPAPPNFYGLLKDADIPRIFSSEKIRRKKLTVKRSDIILDNKPRENFA